MKLDPKRVESFLADPGTCRVVLLYGEDAGLVRERAERLVRAVAGSLDDPFRVTELSRDEYGRISEEVTAMSLTGGRRVVRVRDATDGITDAVKAVFADKSESLLVIEASALPAKGRLRGLVERAADGIALPCYPQDGRALEAGIREALAALGVTAEADALMWLASQLGADRAVTRREVEKLALYAGSGGQISLADARMCVGDHAGLSLEDALFAASAGNVAATDRALELAMAEGATPVGVLRACLQHMQRLQRASSTAAAGLSSVEAMRALRPPVFFQRQDSFVAALRLWPPEALQTICVRLWEAERACKRTGAPAEGPSRSAVLGLAQRAAAMKRRR